MKIWIGGEIESSIEDEFRLARSVVEKAINQKIEFNDYSISVESWDCIAIVRNDDVFSELFKLDESENEMDFRLRIDYQRFRVANTLLQETLVFEMCLRSLDELKKFLGEKEDLNKLLFDVRQVGKLKGWLA